MLESLTITTETVVKLPRESERNTTSPSSKQAGVRMKKSVVQTFRKPPRMNTETGVEADNVKEAIISFYSIVQGYLSRFHD